ncbi:hypothetical protein [Streptomyces otsuchiensis]|uniref:hypothetical protein n=1 Tax=Streptomyces otsuchiensis TaxID=2681388 RepID=UPI001031C773|nr:hypothetical protein [Streptomyces otsuchiensis]
MAPTHRTPPHARHAVRPLHAETVSTVAVVADADAFATLHRCGGLGFDDRDGYLRGLEGHLRRLARRGGQVRVALLDPHEYRDYCARASLAPGEAAARARYAGEVAARGCSVRYHGQGVQRLLAELRTAHDARQTWERCSDQLAAAGRCPRCRGPLAECAFQRAADTVEELLLRAGPGTHRLVCSLVASDGPLSAVLHRGEAAGTPHEGEPRPDGGGDTQPPDASRASEGAVLTGRVTPAGTSVLADPDGLLLCMVLAVALAEGEGAGLLLRTVPHLGAPAEEAEPARPAPRPGEDSAGAPPPQEVRGWAVTGGRLRALSEAEVFMACCTEPGTGEPVPPEAGVAHRAATELPAFHCWEF